MIKRDTKLKWRRLIRRRRKQAVVIGTAGEQSFEKHFIRRLVRIPNIQRFLIGWVGLLFILSVGVVLQTRALSEKYQTLQPLAGGTYVEGIVGSFTNANPLYSSSPVDTSLSKLMFSSLLKYDKNNQLVGDLAESWKLDESERIYTITLRPDVKWHDGQPLTANDVVFTYNRIQNPETKSYLYSSWQNIKVEAANPTTVIFTLSSSLSSFPHSLTNGIVPEHILGQVNPAQLRNNSFNNGNPVGTGPFQFSKVEVIGDSLENRQERIALKPYAEYHSGRPKLESFTVRTFPDENRLSEAYEKKEFTAAAGLPAIPEELRDHSGTAELAVPLTSEVLVFFKTTQEVLQDKEVRKALVLATEKKRIFDKLPYALASIDEPLLKSHLGYDKTLQQVTGKPDEAKKLLDTAGWVADQSTGIRSKGGKPLSFRLYSLNSSEYTTVAGELQKQWRDIGVDMQVELQPDSEFQSTLALHSYDALLYGIALGPDPDVFPYWHGTQADPRSPVRLNFSEYQSKQADQGLEGGRTRSDAQVRSVKYRPFVEAWRNDAPALALYQPRTLYLVHEPFSGFENASMNSAADRYSNVHGWMMRQGLAE